MNLNIKMTLQKLELKFHYNYLIIMLIQNKPEKYNALFDILNITKNLTWDKIFLFLQINRVVEYRYIKKGNSILCL